MFTVKNAHPNASLSINGLKFKPADPGPGVEIEEPVEEAVAAQFRGVKFFEVIDLDAPVAPGIDEDEVASLKSRLQVAGVAIDNRWGVGRLRKEVESLSAPTQPVSPAPPIEAAPAEVQSSAPPVTQPSAAA